MRLDANLDLKLPNQDIRVLELGPPDLRLPSNLSLSPTLSKETAEIYW